MSEQVQEQHEKHHKHPEPQEPVEESADETVAKNIVLESEILLCYIDRLLDE